MIFFYVLDGPVQCRLSCEGMFIDSTDQQLSVNCILMGCSTDGYSCQLDDQQSESCKCDLHIYIVVN